MFFFLNIFKFIMKKITIEVLKAQLQNNGIDLSKWGQGDAKTIEQVFGDGRVRVRDFGRAVSEKMKFGEYSHDAMVRGIQEELGISSNVTLHEIETIVDKKDSPSYPGLMSNYVVDVFKVELTSRQYKSEGYIEERDGLTTYFVWEQI